MGDKTQIPNVNFVRLVKSETKLLNDPKPGKNLQFNLNTTNQVKEEPDSKNVKLRSEIHLVVTQDKPKKRDGTTPQQQIAEFSCIFISDLTYNELLPEPKTLLHSIFPYIQEYISDASRRAGLPTLMIPAASIIEVNPA